MGSAVEFVAEQRHSFEPGTRYASKAYMRMRCTLKTTLGESDDLYVMLTKLTRRSLAANEQSWQWPILPQVVLDLLRTGKLAYRHRLFINSPVSVQAKLTGELQQPVGVWECMTRLGHNCCSVWTLNSVVNFLLLLLRSFNIRCFLSLGLCRSLSLFSLSKCT